jgi:LmbE family N-acetylglucosaminyl deacetylase
VLAASGERARETARAAENLAARQGQISVQSHQFRDGYFPYVGAEIKDVFESLKKSIEPDLIFTHYRHDRHQDHRVVSELTWNTFRDHLVLEYEVPKYDGDLGSPNFFVPIDTDLVEQKVETLMSEFGSQVSRSWFTRETFTALLRLRGIECRSGSGYAEAFYAHKLLLGGVGVQEERIN